MAKYEWQPHPDGGEIYGPKDVETYRALAYLETGTPTALLFGQHVRVFDKAELEDCVRIAELRILKAVAAPALPEGWTFCAAKRSDGQQVYMTADDKWQTARSMFVPLTNLQGATDLASACQLADERFPVKIDPWKPVAACGWDRSDGVQVRIKLSITSNTQFVVKIDGWTYDTWFNTAAEAKAFADAHKPLAPAFGPLKAGDKVLRKGSKSLIRWLRPYERNPGLLQAYDAEGKHHWVGTPEELAREYERVA